MRLVVVEKQTALNVASRNLRLDERLFVKVGVSYGAGAWCLQ